MESRFHREVRGIWSPPLAYLPRWVSVNGIPDLFTSKAPPPSTPTYQQPVNSVLLGYSPGVSGLPFSDAPTLSGSVWAIISDLLLGEAQPLSFHMTRLSLTAFKLADLSESDFLIECDFEGDNVASVEVSVSGLGTTAIKDASSVYELVNSDGPRYLFEGGQLYIHGLDVVQYRAEDRGTGATFIPFASLISQDHQHYVQHPSTKRWLWIHPLWVRSDGLVQFLSGAPDTWLRTFLNSPPATGVSILVNGTPVAFHTVNVWTSADEVGLYFGLQRKEGESSRDFYKGLLGLSWFGDYTWKGMEASLSCMLRLNDGPMVADSNRIPVTGNVLVKGYKPLLIYKERTLFKDPNTGLFVSSRDDYLNSYIVGFAGTYPSFSATGSVVEIKQNVAFPTDLFERHGTVRAMTQTSTGLMILEDEPPPFFVLKVDGVRIAANESVLRKLTVARSPAFRWQDVAAFEDLSQVGTIRNLF